jgi:hypothetical protein
VALGVLCLRHAAKELSSLFFASPATNSNYRLILVPSHSNHSSSRFLLPLYPTTCSRLYRRRCNTLGRDSEGCPNYTSSALLRLRLYYCYALRHYSRWLLRPLSLVRRACGVRRSGTRGNGNRHDCHSDTRWCGIRSLKRIGWLGLRLSSGSFCSPL